MTAAASTRRQHQEAQKALDAARTKSDQAFVLDYVQPSGSSWPSWQHPTTGAWYRLRLRRAERLAEAELEACLRLVEATSGDDYRRAEAGWHPRRKRREMRSPGLRYLLVTDAADESLAAFVSLMPTLENGEPVVYCYEIHLQPALRGVGLGKLLMRHVLAAADNMPAVRAVMLTCFVANARAGRFYRDLGFRLDDSSPRARRLRSGRLLVPDYEILRRETVPK